MRLTETIVGKYIDRYYSALKKFKHHQAENESTTETALKDMLHNVALDLGLTLVKTSSQGGGGTRNLIIPDGIIKDDLFRVIGYWEAKDNKDKLDAEIYKKIKKGYPLTNTIFEDTQIAILYQDGREFHRYNLSKGDQLIALLIQFFNYNEPVYEEFRIALQKFKENIARLSDDFRGIIHKAKAVNNDFKNAIHEFREVCGQSFHHDISADDIEDMLVQHLLTERIFRNIFDNPDFTTKNVIAIQLEKLITILTRHAFNRKKFFQATDVYFIAIEEEAAKFDDFKEKQGFLNKIYEEFFKSYSKKNADKNGIVYTPQSIVKFMVKFTENVLRNEFGKSLSAKGVNIIDPCTGTGNFIMEVLKNIDAQQLDYKYRHEIFANELMLLPYYIASSNIEHFYYDAKGEYVQFENIVFTDTLELIEDPRRKDAQQKLDFFFNEANSDRAKRELKTDLFVIIGNPPYNASQENEDQNNKNTTNEIVDGRVSDTYAKSSNAQLKNKLYDPYVKFIRWASDRLNKQNGIVCFITNNSFLTDVQFDGMRQHLMDDFNRIYHFNLGGDVYLNPKLSGTKHNVFGIKVGVGITFLIRNNKYSDHKIYYHPLPEHLTRIEKEEVISEYQEKFENLTDIDWEEGFLSSSNSFSFDSSDIEAAKEYDEFIDLFNESEGNNDCIFKVKYPGINTARNEWVYSFSEEELEPRMKRTIHFYNDEVTRLEHYIQEKRVRNIGTVNLDKFVKIEVDKIKWSAGLKSHLRRLEKVKYSKDFIEKSAFRPFVDKLLYNQRIFVDRPSNFKTLNATDNLYLTFSGLGAKRVSAFITAISPNFDLLEKTQVFPLFEVKQKEEKGEPVIKIETNVTDWALGFFRAKCRDAKIKPEDIFYYVYGILHNTSFINHYSNLLKTTNPRIPLVANRFAEISGLGRKLAALHLNYNLEKPISLRLTKETLKTLTKNKKKIDYSIEKMKISRDKLILTYNNDLEYFIPKEAWGYEVNGRTPLEWIVDQYKDYQASSDEIIQLIERCITVTKKSQELIDELSTTKFKSKAQKIIAA